MDSETTSAEDEAKLMEQIDAGWEVAEHPEDPTTSPERAQVFVRKTEDDAAAQVAGYVDKKNRKGALVARMEAVRDRIRARSEKARKDVAAVAQDEVASGPAKEPASVDAEKSQQIEKQTRAEAQERLTSVMQEFERARQGGDPERIDLCYGNAMKAYDHLIDAYASAKVLDVNERLDLGAMRCDKQIVHHEHQASLLKAEMDAATDPKTRKEKEAAWMKERDAQKNFLIAKNSILQRKNKKVEPEGANGPVSGKVIDPMESVISLIMAMHDPGTWVEKVAGGLAGGKSEQSH
jgi:hypothetical protein